MGGQKVDSKFERDLQTARLGIMAERVVHAKGSVLNIAKDISRYTKTSASQKGRALIGFSTVAGERGAAVYADKILNGRGVYFVWKRTSVRQMYKIFLRIGTWCELDKLTMPMQIH
ncbi:MAG: catalase [Campylobacteraceae bacterium]|nr:catalase [Campylobacteraceae bacterium]